MSDERVPPQNIEAEISVLGAAIQWPAALLLAMEILRPQDFYRQSHSRVFEACASLFDRGDPVDLVTVCNELQARKHLEEVGGSAGLVGLVDAVPTGVHAAQYAKIVREKALLRELAARGTAIASRAYADTGSASELTEWAEQQIFAIAQAQSGNGFLHLGRLLKPLMLQIEAAADRGTYVTGVPTGFRHIDRMTAGLQPGELTVIGGRPAMGKTALALNIAEHVAVDQKVPVAIFSLEMAKQQLAQRLICSMGRVDSTGVRTGLLHASDWPKLSAAAGALSEAPIFVDDASSLSVLSMRARARRLMADRKIGLILVDYLQLMESGHRVDSRQEEIAQISRGLKAMARELNVPVIVLSQLSRLVENRTPPRPQLSDLRDSGAIEQDADVVMFLYRPGYYRRKESDPDEEEDNTTEVIVSKQRQGPTGTAFLAFLRKFTRFEEQERQRGG